jgi:O-antigen/teichoic acid export membrane protein
MLMLQTLGSLDLWFLKVAGPSNGDVTMGLYVAARNVALVPSVIFMVISDVLLPSLSAALAANDAALSRRYLQGGVRFLCITMLPTCVLFGLGADQIMAGLYSSRFEGGGLYLRILIWYALALPFLDLFAAALNARGEPFTSGKSLLLVVPAALVLNALLVPSYGAVGAAAANAAVGAGAAVLLGVVVYRRFGPLVTFRTVGKTLTALGLMAGVASQFTLTGPVLGIVYLGCLALYAGTLILLGEVTRSELASVSFLAPSQRPDR